jgi:hypothetical protein
MISLNVVYNKINNKINYHSFQYSCLNKMFQQDKFSSVILMMSYPKYLTPVQVILNFYYIV